jgi:UPF0755 protein
MKWFLRFTLALIVAAAVGGFWVMNELNQPYKGFTEPVFIEFAHGTSSQKMADLLAQRGVIPSSWVFLAARELRRGVNLQAGEYKFDKAASPLDVLGRISRGDIYYVEFLAPEGYNMFDIAAAVAKVGLSPDEFLAAARNPAPIRDLVPQAKTLEGYLFPSKYRVYKHTTAHQLCLMMVTEFRIQWKTLKSGANLHDTVTLASMVEKEARRPDERPVIASVFTNRLHIGMKLDCDPTTVYAALLDGRYRGTIYRSDLENESPWNTYRHAGLPPGPIANPGLGTIRAALAPADTQYLYFVARADGTGGHAFSESLAKHAEAVAQYRRATAQ